MNEKAKVYFRKYASDPDCIQLPREEEEIEEVLKNH